MSVSATESQIFVTEERAQIHFSTEDSVEARVEEAAFTALPQEILEGCSFDAAEITLDLPVLAETLKTTLVATGPSASLMLELAVAEVTSGLDATDTIEALAAFIERGEDSLEIDNWVSLEFVNLALLGSKTPLLEERLLTALVRALECRTEALDIDLAYQMASLLIYALNRGYDDLAAQVMTVSERSVDEFIVSDAFKESWHDGEQEAFLDLFGQQRMLNFPPFNAWIRPVDSFNQEVMQRLNDLIDRLTAGRAFIDSDQHLSIQLLKGKSVEGIVAEITDPKFAALCLDHAVMLYAFSDPHYAAELLKRSIELGGNETPWHQYSVDLSANEADVKSYQITSHSETGPELKGLEGLIIAGLAMQEPESALAQMKSWLEALGPEDDMEEVFSSLTLMTGVYFLQGRRDLALEVVSELCGYLPKVQTVEIETEMLGVLAALFPEERARLTPYLPDEVKGVLEEMPQVTLNQFDPAKVSKLLPEQIRPVLIHLQERADVDFGTMEGLSGLVAALTWLKVAKDL